MYFDTADFLFVENHKNTFLKLWYVTNIFTGTADFVNSLDFYGLKWYYNITQWRQNGALREFLRLGGRYFLRGDRQDQQKKLSDEQLVLNAQSDKTAIGELIARYICTVEFLAKK